MIFTATVCTNLSRGPGTRPIPPPLQSGLIFLHQYTYVCIDGFAPLNDTQQMTVNCRSDGTLSLPAPPQCVSKFHNLVI